MTLIEELKWRGFYGDTMGNCEGHLKSGEVFYIGTDPTSIKPENRNPNFPEVTSSLHCGHLAAFMCARLLQERGMKPIILVGGATARMGDPSGKTSERALLSDAEISNNIECIRQQLMKLIDFNSGKDNVAIMVNNNDWISKMSFIDFEREIGKLITVNYMMAKESVKRRFEREGCGISHLEMSYMLVQAYDFVHLNEKYGCVLEWGGADQWGNIVAGTELGRKLNLIDNKNRQMIGATNPLLLTPEGKKMGKTEKGAIWIDKDKISAYDFYQGIYQTPDACVEMMFALFTDLPMEHIRQIIKEDIVKAKKELCFEITKFVRGEKDALLAQQMSENLFAQGGDNAPEFALDRAYVKEGIGICDLLVMTKLCSSKSDARRMIEGGGVSMKGEKVSDFALIVKESDFENNSILLKKGKKNFVKVVLK